MGLGKKYNIPFPGIQYELLVIMNITSESLENQVYTCLCHFKIKFRKMNYLNWKKVDVTYTT